jgi:hypothetical protein|tara:strand:+ start:86 stop:472 length:387 start_codon:yes stop_codon:yes gene_type:complete
MPIATITFQQPINSSLQKGDIVYYSSTDTAPYSIIETTVTSNIVKLGSVFSITADPPTVHVNYDDDPGNTGNATVFPPSIYDYVMFEKDKQVNSSSLVGYYADIKLTNNSKKKIELFSLGSEVTESSK